ncbi:MAG: glycosyltransferase [Microgenomates group bacterium]
MRVALVYDHLNKIGGAEQVLVAFAELYPEADWYTSFWNPRTAPFSKGWKVHSFPYLHSHHEWFPWVMPFIFESYDLRTYDLVISIGSAAAKGVITGPQTIHLNYCLTPTRYLYSHKDEYLSNPIYRLIGKYLRKWDTVASTRPDTMIAISTQVKNRIKKYYNRDVEIIFPPVDIHKYTPNMPARTVLAGGYFLTVSRLVPYKKINILIQAANLAQVNLVVIGEGSEYKKLKNLAGPTVNLLGYIPDQELPSYYQNSLAYLHGGEEDFGISMCESLASGRPVIAYGQGGSKDIVIPGKNGVLLESNTIASFAKAMKEFDTMSFVAADCIASASKFDKTVWKRKIKERIKDLWIKNQK